MDRAIWVLLLFFCYFLIGNLSAQEIEHSERAERISGEYFFVNFFFSIDKVLAFRNVKANLRALPSLAFIWIFFSVFQ